MIKYLLKNKMLLGIFIILVPISCIFSIEFALSFQPIINSAIDKNISALYSAITYSAIFAFLDVISILILKYIKENILKKTYITLKEDLFKNILNMNISDFKEKNSGNFISILNNDIDIIGNSYYRNYLDIYQVFISFILSFITVVFLNYTIALILLIVGLCSVIIPKLFEKKLSIIQGNYSNSMNTYISKIKDIFEGFEIIKSFNIQKNIIDNHSKYNRIEETSRCKSSTYIYSIGWISMAFSSLMYVLTFAVGGYFAIIGVMSVGLIVSLSQLIGGVVSPIERLPSMLSDIYSTKEIKNKILGILKTECENDTGMKLNESIKDIDVKNISFYYDTKEKLSLSNINIKFESNKKYAIVGESGSGKSTLVKLLLRFYKCSMGEILINRNNINDLSANSIYNSISYIHQNTFLFDDTFRNNITLYNKYTDEEILNVIRLAGLSDLVEKLESGLDTHIGENGSFLSGGEKQRIGIARALICKSNFLILDEATSSLDNITAHNIINTILNLKNTGNIIITHNLNENLLKQCDCIYVLKNGLLLEEGSLEQLLNNKGYFSELYKLNN